METSANPPLPSNHMLSLTTGDRDDYTVSLSQCSTLTITMDYIAFTTSTVPSLYIYKGVESVQTTVSDPSPTTRVLTSGTLEPGDYQVHVGPALNEPLSPNSFGYQLNSTIVPTAYGCTGAKLVGWTLPNQVEAGSTFNASTTFENTGATTWKVATAEYSVRSTQNGAAFNLPNGVPLAYDVSTGRNWTANLQLTAPTSPGPYVLSFEMYRNGPGFFGDATPQAVVQVVSTSGDQAEFVAGAGYIPQFICQPPAIFRYAVINKGNATWSSSNYAIQLFHREANTNQPWKLWLNQPIPATVAPGGTATVDVVYPTMATGDQGYWEVRAELWRGQIPVGPGSAVSAVSIGLSENLVPEGKFLSFASPGAVGEGEPAEFRIHFMNTGCVAWTNDGGFAIDAAAGAWTPTSIAMNPAVVPVGGYLDMTFQSTPVNYVLVEGEPVMQAAWRVRSPLWTAGISTDVRTIQIAHAYAQCLSIQVPNPVAAGSSFTASAVLKNTGETAWSKSVGYRLGYTPPDAATWGDAYVELDPGDSISPDGTKQFTWTAHAPSQPGTYSFNWMMYRGTQYFFDACIGGDISVQ